MGGIHCCGVVENWTRQRWWCWWWCWINDTRRYLLHSGLVAYVLSVASSSVCWVETAGRNKRLGSMRQSYNGVSVRLWAVCCWWMGWWVAWHSSNTRKRVSVKGERLSERRRRERLKWTICLFNYNCNYVNCVIIDCAIETCHKATRRGKTRAVQKTVCPLQCYLSLSNAYGG